MSQLRSTCSSSKKSSGISDNFIEIAQGSTLSPDASAPAPRRSTSIASSVLPSGCQVGDEGEDERQDENFDLGDQSPRNHDITEDSNQNFGPPEPEPQSTESLAQTLRLLVEKIGNLSEPSRPRSKIHHRVPDVFDGTDTSKLETFVFQLSMYISSRKGDFPDDEAKVAFALSYLKGVPLDWFQGEVSRALNDGGSFPTWFDDFPNFIEELRRLFGPRDPINDATNAIEALRYKDSTKAARYTIDFNRYAHRTGWNDTALTRQYYKGLPDRLKDEIARIGKPGDLSSLQALVATLDQRYWERQSEISRDKRSNASHAPSNTKLTSSDNRTDNRSNNASHNTESKANNHQQTKNKDQKKPQANANASGSGNKSLTVLQIYSAPMGSSSQKSIN